MLRIVTVPNTILTTQTKTITSFDNKLQAFVRGMENTLRSQKNPEGVGLAAPQVGESLSVFIIKPGKNAGVEAFINPKILTVKSARGRETKKDEPKTVNKMEGCLSIPRIWAPLTRHGKILLSYQDATGKKHTKWFSGFKAVVIQHEVDHLAGILFTKRCIEQNVQLYEEHGKKLEKMTSV